MITEFLMPHIPYIDQIHLNPTKNAQVTNHYQKQYLFHLVKYI